MIQFKPMESDKMNKVIFETQGNLDIRAIKTFGINSKPHTKNPIGYFGTGLKYAIAVLMREGCSVRIIINKKTHHIEVQPAMFREKEFGFITMNGEELPFTTELGKNWKMWQAFRELYSNTLDEGGDAYVPHMDNVRFSADRTYIVVESEAFVREFDERYNTFLRGGAITGTSGVQIIDAASHHIFYRGVRIHDLQKPSSLTYNILHQIDLTEDRTAKYPYQLDHHIMEALAGSNDQDQIKKALNATEDEYEAKLDFSEVWQTPTDAFTVVGRTAANRTAYSLTKKHDKDWLQMQRERHIFDQMVDCIKANEWHKFRTIAEENANAVLCLLLSADRESIMKEVEEPNGNV